MDLVNALSFAVVAALLVISPGPNGVLIVKTVAMSGKVAGFANVAGFVAAFHFHGALSILGISAIFLASPNLFFVVKLLGAAYLCWIGVKALRDALSDNNGTLKVKALETSNTSKDVTHYLKEVEQSRLLTAAEEISYTKLVQKGDEEARAMMIACNERLLVNIARLYLNRGLTLIDLIEAGKPGLIHSVESFDPDSGFRFATYASWWIRQNIEQALMIQARNIPWPSHMVNEMNIYLKAERRLRRKMEREPTAEDIAVECDKPLADVKRMLVLRDRISSIDVSIEPDGGRSLLNVILNDNKPRTTSRQSAFFEGFLTNVLNPKTSMFYLAAFPQFITIGERAAASAYTLVFLHTLINVAWFGTMVILFTRLARFSLNGSFQRWLKGVTGAVFIGFGVKLATFTP